MQVPLTESEQLVVRELARLRYELSRMHNIPNERIANLPDGQIDLEGVAAEWAFCKALNVYPDLEGGPRQYDCKYYGKTIDVKSTQREQGRLIVRPEKADDPCDYYALVTGTFPGPYTIRGVAEAQHVFAQKRLTDLGYGPVYAMPQADLYPFEQWAEDMFLLHA